MNGFRITSKAELLNAVAQCSREAPHFVPLLMVAHRDELSLACVGRGKAAPLRLVDRARNPAAVVIGDDAAGGFDPGPAGFPGLPRLMRWARFAVVNATGGVRQHYETFVALTIVRRKLLLIETGTARADAWIGICQRAEVPTFILTPQDGGFHPVLSKRGGGH